MRPITITRQLTAADPDGICADQSLGAAGDLLINGALAVGGVATLDVQRRVELESANDLSTVNFTVVGTDDQDRQVTEVITGPNAGVSSGSRDFKTVTQVSVDAAVTNVEVGTNGLGASREVPMDQYSSAPFNVGLGVLFNGVADVTVQFTFDDVYAGDGIVADAFQWLDHPDLSAVVANADGTFIAPVTACRLLTNSGVGEATLRILQAGIT